MGQLVSRILDGGFPQETCNEITMLANLLERAADPQDRSVAPISTTLNKLRQLAYVPVSPKVYRSHFANIDEVCKYGLRRNIGASHSQSDYIADIIAHTARTGGSEGKVLSLTNNIHVARGFLTQRKLLVTISTINSFDRYQNISKIILNNSNLLLRQRKIKPATIAQAVRQIIKQNEDEVFYLDGDIPPSDVIEIHDNYGNMLKHL